MKLREINIAVNLTCLLSTLVFCGLTMTNSPFIHVAPHGENGPEILKSISNAQLLRDHCEIMAYQLQMISRTQWPYLVFFTLSSLVTGVACAIGLAINIRQNPSEDPGPPAPPPTIS